MNFDNTEFYLLKHYPNLLRVIDLYFEKKLMYDSSDNIQTLLFLAEASHFYEISPNHPKYNIHLPYKEYELKIVPFININLNRQQLINYIYTLIIESQDSGGYLFQKEQLLKYIKNNSQVKSGWYE